ncbi:MAG: CTP-dependent riboflavin kinase [Desulfobacterales bacterium]|nr:CTP-dependent riboflavin kinase [Desulfobacterales bacterium]
MEIAGKIISGAGEGAYFTQIDWVRQQCQEKLGFKPHPGTLNLEIAPEHLLLVAALNQKEGIELISPNPKFCNAKAFAVELGKLKGAIIIPEERVRIHAENIIEIIAPLSIKASLNVNDGDYIKVVLTEE